MLGVGLWIDAPFVTMHLANAKSGHGPNNDTICTIADLHFVRRSVTNT